VMTSHARDLDYAHKLTRVTLTCQACGARHLIDQQVEGVSYCQCPEKKSSVYDVVDAKCCESDTCWAPFVGRPSSNAKTSSFGGGNTTSTGDSTLTRCMGVSMTSPPPSFWTSKWTSRNSDSNGTTQRRSATLSRRHITRLPRVAMISAQTGVRSITGR